LGHFYAGQPDNPYVDVLVERLADVYSQPPEHERVRQMCAVSLGRMKAAAALPTLRRFYQTEGSNMPAGLACGWAIQQITGEPYQPPKQILLYRQGWFLSPWK
jgi:HEAT repeat protein